MEQLVKFIFGSAGLAWILCESLIFKKLREKITDLHNKHGVGEGGNRLLARILWLPRQLFKCPACMGFWTGILNYFLIYVWKLDVVAYPLIATICCYILVAFGKHLERKF
jgi:hypothetical protein